MKYVILVFLVCSSIPVFPSGMPITRMQTAEKSLICAHCGDSQSKTVTLKYCGGCKSVTYCSHACQKAHWKEHKCECKNLQGNNKEKQEHLACARGLLDGLTSGMNRFPNMGEYFSAKPYCMCGTPRLDTTFFKSLSKDIQIRVLHALWDFGADGQANKDLITKVIAYIKRQGVDESLLYFYLTGMEYVIRMRIESNTKSKEPESISLAEKCPAFYRSTGRDREAVDKAINTMNSALNIQSFSSGVQQVLREAAWSFREKSAKEARSLYKKFKVQLSSAVQKEAEKLKAGSLLYHMILISDDFSKSNIPMDFYMGLMDQRIYLDMSNEDSQLLSDDSLNWLRQNLWTLITSGPGASEAIRKRYMVIRPENQKEATLIQKILEAIAQRDDAQFRNRYI